MNDININQDRPQLIRLDIRINGMRKVKEVLYKLQTDIKRNNTINKKG